MAATRDIQTRTPSGAVQAQLPPENIPISSGGPWRRFLEALWRKTGGFGDSIFDAAVLAQTGDATLAELAAQGEQLAREVENLRAAQDNSRVMELEGEIRALRGVVEGLKGSVDAAMADNASALIIERLAALQTAGVTTLADELRQEMADLKGIVDGAQQAIAAIRGDTYATDQIEAGLGSAASYDIGTSGNAVPLLDASNTWSLQQVFTQAPDAPGYNVGGVQVVGGQDTGWSACTGSALKGGFATYTAPTVSATYAQAEVQAIADALQNASRTIAALIDKDLAAGNIGA